jgi:hypothetical protein
MIIGNVELNRCSGSITIQKVIYSAFNVYNERNLNHHQAEFLAQIQFDVILNRIDGLLRILRT